MGNEVELFLSQQSKKNRSILNELISVFQAEECTAYVKTIYLGIDFGGEMVAAAYPSAENVEIALALEEDNPHPALLDATHLTWRTLPLSIKLESKADVQKYKELLAEAAERVRQSRHEVFRDNDYFTSAKRRRKEERLSRRRSQ